MKKQILILLVTALIIFPLVSADVILERVDKSSSPAFTEKLNVELRDAEVIINFSDSDGSLPRLTATFKVYSNEKDIVKTKVYLKAKGKRCYGSCRDVDITEHATLFRIRNTEPIVINYENGAQTVIDIYDFKESPTIIEINGENFSSSKEFILAPKQVMIIEVDQGIDAPYEYYLDSLSTFSKADHEKITIIAPYDVTFNDKYPLKLISEENNMKTWVWEYSNINTSDEALKDVLIIGENNLPPRKLSFFERIVNWFKSLFS